MTLHVYLVIKYNHAIHHITVCHAKHRVFEHDCQE
jgi:hypothetical protein